MKKKVTIQVNYAKFDTNTSVVGARWYCLYEIIKMGAYDIGFVKIEQS